MNLWPLAATVALLPLLVPAGPGESAPVDALALLYILLALAALIRRGRSVHLPANGALALIAGASLLATASSLDLAASLLSILVEAYLVLLLVCVANDLGGDRRGIGIVLAVWSLAALGWTALLVGSSLELLPQGLQELLGAGSPSGGDRVAGASKNPNLAASYLMISFFVVLASPWPRRRPARLAAAGWLLFGVYVTGSNGALLGLVAGVAVLAVAAVLRAGRTRGQRFGVIGACLVAGTLLATILLLAVGVPTVEVAAVQDVARREQDGVFGDSLGRLDRSVPGRLELWTEAWRGAGARVLVGVGPGSAPLIPLAATTLRKGLHNDYLAFLIERGVLGLLGLLGFCTVLLRWCGRLLGASVQGLAGLAGGVVANLLLAASHESFHFRHVWVLFGLVWAAARLTSVPPPTPAAEPSTQVPGELAHAGR
jgi:O-antigen ligase